VGYEQVRAQPAMRAGEPPSSRFPSETPTTTLHSPRSLPVETSRL